MSIRSQNLALLAAAVSGLTIAIVSLVRMFVPGFLDALPQSLIGRLGSGVELAVSLTGALAVIAVSIIALATGRDAKHAGASRALRVTGLIGGVLAAVTMPGGVIPAAGYTFAMVVIVGIVVLITLTAIRRPWVGLPLAAAATGLLIFAVVNLQAGRLVPSVFGAMAGILPQMLLALAHVIAAAGLLVWAISDASGSRSVFARFVLRHRTPITLVAAACAVPYAFVRATWLTPWPLFGGGGDVFSEDPAVRLLGLALGLAMLVGGVLTLGLIMRWGERFPRFLAGVGGRPVPVALALIPASVVSVLFTAAGIEFVLEGAGSMGDTSFLLLMFPFWLWGPLLGLAAWGYTMHRSAPVPPAGARKNASGSGAVGLTDQPMHQLHTGE
ncbi:MULTISPECIES: hypothetical protein [unclassified Microbacterium]|uniref:hypothetical protein n=1 Tax=unclassified Microbacterium TaxID=2609290 RepID=UPI000EA923BD|nr:MULTISPECIES: hypothetical protein [unclassified Microbacterium]MBT2483480.1 hypothetical protein [Microbacterium sp. ISL-108]RKN66499.1 hypothetical protein D7252_02070 [Microbacterium sp. CGR2]